MQGTEAVQKLFVEERLVSNRLTASSELAWQPSSQRDQFKKLMRILQDSDLAAAAENSRYILSGIWLTSHQSCLLWLGDGSGQSLLLFVQRLQMYVASLTGGLKVFSYAGLQGG